jgi:hypothetical protein
MKTKLKQGYKLTSERNDYQTPPEVYNTILKFIGRDEFDMDVCCSELNIPAMFYLQINGLTHNWSYKHTTCWMNPPFATAKKWLEKAYEESKKDCEVWGIIPCRTETKYFKDFIMQNENAFYAPLQKGISFINPETKDPMGVFKNPLCIISLGKRASEHAYNWNIKKPFNSVAFVGVKSQKKQ